MFHDSGPAVAIAALAILACGALATAAAAAAPLATFTVEAGKVDRIDVPVSAALEGINATKPLRLEEVSSAGRTPVPVQVEAGQPPRLWWILSGKTAAGTSRRFELVAGDPPVAPTVLVRKTPEAIDVSLSVKDAGGAAAEAKVLRYHVAVVEPPPGIDRKYRRSGYINPVWTPSGLVVTDDFPPGHLHHKGVWMPWTKTEFEGRHPDFWNLGQGTGTVRHAGLGSIAAGPVYGSFEAAHEFVDLSAPGGEKVALKETWVVRVWQAGGPQAGYFIWDLTSTQRCASASPLKLPKYHYGGIGYRGPRQWLGEDGCKYLTSEGRGRKDGNATTGRWCDVWGPVSGKQAGVVLMSHPLNFRHPEPMRLHPNEPFACFAPSQGGDWTIEPGKDYVFRYRFCVHDGEMKPADIDRLWADFGDPPVVKVTR